MYEYSIRLPSESKVFLAFSHQDVCILLNDKNLSTFVEVVTVFTI